MSKFNIPEWIDPCTPSGVLLWPMMENHRNGWDRVFPYNAGTGPIDPVWTDPGNNIRIRLSEIRRFGW